MLLGAGGALARVAVQRAIGSAWKLSAGLLLHVELGRAHVVRVRCELDRGFPGRAVALQAALGVAYAF